MKNRSLTKTYVVSGTLNVDSVLYTNKKRNEVKTMRFEEEIRPDTVHTLRMEVTFHEYYKKLLDQASFNISCMAKVDGTDYDYFAQDDFRVRKPNVQIVLVDEPIAQRELDVTLQLTNPLPIALKKAIFNVEGTGISKQVVLKVPEVSAYGTASATFRYLPRFSGRATFIAKFYSKELDDVDGFLAFEIQPRPEDIIVGTTYHSNGYIRRPSIY